MQTIESGTEANRRLVADMYDAVTHGDLEGFLRNIADDVVVREPRFVFYGGIYSGKDELLGLLGRLSGILNVTGLRIDGLVADGDRVIGLVRGSLLDGSGDVSLAEMSVIRDGKIVEMQIFFHEAATLLDGA